MVKAAAKEDVQLHWAAGFGRVEPVKVLVELGAGKEAKRDDRSTPLRDAAREGHVAAMRLLVVLGADMEAKDAREVTRCIWNAKYGHVEAIRVLVALGAEKEAKNIDGETPLQLCLRPNIVRPQRVEGAAVSHPHEEEGCGQERAPHPGAYR